jgi:hypothetical protein
MATYAAMCHNKEFQISKSNARGFRPLRWGLQSLLEDPRWQVLRRPVGSEYCQGQQTEISLPQNNFKTHQSNKSTPTSERQIEVWACINGNMPLKFPKKKPQEAHFNWELQLATSV